MVYDKLHSEKDEVNDGALRMRFLASLGMTMFALGERGLSQKNYVLSRHDKRHLS